MKKYELLIILNGSLKENEKKDLLVDIEKNISGKIKKQEDLGIKKFSYKIKGKEEGNYINIFFENEPEKIKNINAYLQLEKNVIRYILLTHNKWPFDLRTTKLLASKKIEFQKRFKPNSRGSSNKKKNNDWIKDDPNFGKVENEKNDNSKNENKEENSKEIDSENKDGK